MPQLQLKPTHKVVQDYYESLAQFAKLGIKHEGAVRSAFQTLLESCGRQFEWKLVPEYRSKGKAAAHPRDARAGRGAASHTVSLFGPMKFLATTHQPCFHSSLAIEPPSETSMQPKQHANPQLVGCQNRNGGSSDNPLHEKA